MDVSIWLSPHNRTEMDSLAKELYDPASPNFGQWLDNADFAARFAPTAAEAKKVQNFMTAHHLQVVSTGPNNFFVRARGTVANVQNAFHIGISRFQIGSQVFYGNTSDPYVEGVAGTMVAAVYGLDNLQFKHPVATRPNLAAKAPGNHAANALQHSAVAPALDADFFTSNCFTAVKTETFTTSGSYPTATYKGNTYNGAHNTAGCGYTPAEIQTAYNLTPLYKAGFDGTGQHIVIVDWCGSPTVLKDANAFSARFGLPPLNSSNFKITNFPTPSACAGPDVEINLDVEWAHAIAPGAAIDLVISPSASFMDVDAATLYAVVAHLGNVVSGSFGADEPDVPPNVLAVENLIAESAALFGISTNYSSGDYGDNTFDIDEDPVDFPPTVSAPASSPYATAVGGVSLALNSKNGIAFQTGWGTNITFAVSSGFVYDPPANGGFYYGSGGGASQFFSKPSFQSKLPGKARQLPDISWLADPYTGGVIAITQPGFYPPLIWEAVGGTSLSCPMFSALWAIANQEAGRPLGQAAPYLYRMPAGAITDVVPYSSVSNVTAVVTDSPYFSTSYSAADLAAPLENTSKFYSAIFDDPLFQDSSVVLMFGTDTHLKTATGWDNVTGVGTPNGKAFADAFRPGGPFGK